jgi:predicted metal-dependent phosphotriesterase family hydrolase
VTAVRTVLGDIAPGDLGVCDAHDHLFGSLAALTEHGLGPDVADQIFVRNPQRAFAADWT